jgi:Nuclease-related domain
MDEKTRQVRLRQAGMQSPAESPLVDAGSPGASLEREFGRRKQKRGDLIRARHPRVGGLILALSEEPASTRAFALGAEGERRAAARLQAACGDDALFLHNRRLGRTSQNGDIDHIAVAASGVYVIDTKHYKHARVRVRRSGGVFSPVREQLMIDGRDKTALVVGLNRQLLAVIAAVAEQPIPVSALFCFVDADLPLGCQRIRGIPILGARRVGRMLRRPGPLDARQRQEFWTTLARRLPPA